LLTTIREDIRTVFAKDPAARSVLEVLTVYPGLHAIWWHRIASWLWRRRLRYLARLVSNLGRFFTTIEIHPAATVGRRLFIDHGAGVVFGETAVVGNDVLIYQGVVLGGTALSKTKRHPTVGNDVVIGTGAVALGPITIGDGARIGAGSVVINSVPPGATVVGIPGRVVEDRPKTAADLEHGKLPDPVAEAIRLVLREQDKLEERLRSLEETSGVIVSEDELEEERRSVVKDFNQGGGI
jgi:serine O-acetyltransferase